MTLSPSDQRDRAQRFRELHTGPDTFVMPNPWDAGSARLLEAAGFPALATTSAGIAFSLGYRDGAGMVTRQDALNNARALVDASSLPVAADLENCYSDDLEGIAATIEAAAAAGLVGGSIEDSSSAGIYSLSEATDRVAAAVAAARALPFEFTLTARAENHLHGHDDLDDTIARLRAFADAGADVLFAPGLPSLDAVAAVCEAVDKPVSVMAGLPGQGWTVAQLRDMGVRRISVGPALALAAFGALNRAATEITESGSFGFADEAAGFGEISGLMASPE